MELLPEIAVLVENVMKLIDGDQSRSRTLRLVGKIEHQSEGQQTEFIFLVGFGDTLIEFHRLMIVFVRHRQIIFIPRKRTKLAVENYFDEFDVLRELVSFS